MAYTSAEHCLPIKKIRTEKDGHVKWYKQKRKANNYTFFCSFVKKTDKTACSARTYEKTSASNTVHSIHMLKLLRDFVSASNNMYASFNTQRTVE